MGQITQCYNQLNISTTIIEEPERRLNRIRRFGICPNYRSVTIPNYRVTGVSRQEFSAWLKAKIQLPPYDLDFPLSSDGDDTDSVLLVFSDDAPRGLAMLQYHMPWLMARPHFDMVRTRAELDDYFNRDSDDLEELYPDEMLDDEYGDCDEDVEDDDDDLHYEGGNDV